MVWRGALFLSIVQRVLRNVSSFPALCGFPAWCRSGSRRVVLLDIVGWIRQIRWLAGSFGKSVDPTDSLVGRFFFFFFVRKL